MINTQDINLDKFNTLPFPLEEYCTGAISGMTSTFQEGVSLPGSEKGALKSIDKNQASQLLLKGKRVHSIPPIGAKVLKGNGAHFPFPEVHASSAGHAFSLGMCSHHFAITHGNVSAEFSTLFLQERIWWKQLLDF
ncbi:hypothetical protein CDAR_104851 [Caerostris darwini]|uniref:Uncharacterized protein n=1 Tax=Caerostris darwini TaxID=1538125 RepID=A0AAV4W2Y4_9ARAC|nr:hypothetical protein CDAR_104851 [Caerostris darwini]